MCIRDRSTWDLLIQYKQIFQMGCQSTKKVNPNNETNVNYVNVKVQEEFITPQRKNKRLDWKLNLTSEQQNVMNDIQNLNKIVFNFNDFIGKGQYGQVYNYTIRNTSLAVKIFQYEEEIEREKEAIESIQTIAGNCPGIIKYYGMKQLDIEITGIFPQQYSGYALFLEKCQSDLSRFQGSSKKEVLNFLSQISLSLFCLHSNGFFHGDIKPANILMSHSNSQQTNYYLTDYGEGKCLEELITNDSKTLTLRGTPYYFAPEVADAYNSRSTFSKYNPLSVDIYALGIVCLEFLLGQQTVFQLNMEKSSEEQYNKKLEIIKNELLKNIDEFQKDAENELLLTLIKMVSFHQDQRPQAIQICQALISSQLFQMDALQNDTLKALIAQLISQFRPISKKKIQLNTINQMPQMPLIAQIHETSQMALIPETSITKDFETIEIPTFQSTIIKKSAYSTLIISLFEKYSVNLSTIHYQKIDHGQKLDAQKFHSQCDEQGSTLVIFKSNDEPSNLFGGMAVPEWKYKDCDSKDPSNQCSWLFKIEFIGEQVNLHQ
eukprot:TRINITY_DN498_c0_g1_i8.p1 TRINITY_DN498_c0_g1~~TRINITY_DN498_c0_g1_i8.p1  ORF type:complete len:547 (+),score=60.82 TRINITY_DN498_c0_g1_i8:75-1715(+)